MPASLLYALFIWAVVTLALIAVAVYRGFLAKDETDRIFDGSTESRQALRQRQTIAKVSRLDGVVKGLAVASGSLLVLCTVVWIWSSLAHL